MYRAYKRLSSAERESQAGTQSGRGESLVPSGSMPAAVWRAKVASRHESQPWSKRPR